MKLFDFLKAWEPSFSPQSAKVHLARFNGSENPLDVFIEGRFEAWQCWQSNRNFGRDFVVSLIQAGTPTRWMYAGLFRVNGCTARSDPEPHFDYELSPVPAAQEWVGRLFLGSDYKQRNSYLLGETLADDLEVLELRPQRLSISEFPGYKNIHLPKSQLDIVIGQNLASWRSALASVKGIYLITDTRTGRLYVGKADGADGIWGRWTTYSETTHGHNVALVQEFGFDAPPERQNDLRFSLLEIADLNARKEDIDARENHWKEVLMTRQHGYNRN